MQRIITFNNNSTCYGKWTVEPGVENGTTIHFGVKLDDATITLNGRIGLDAETRRVAVSGNNLKATFLDGGTDLRP